MKQKFFGPFFQKRTAFFLLFVWGPANAATVTGAWARATAPAQDTAAIYLTIASDRATTLTAAETPAASMAMFHQTTRSATMSDMQDLPAITIPAHGQAIFAPGGRHIMLMGLKHPLVAGKSIGLTLIFADGEKQTLTVPVQPIRASGPPPPR